MINAISSRSKSNENEINIEIIDKRAKIKKTHHVKTITVNEVVNKTFNEIKNHNIDIQQINQNTKERYM